MSNYTDAPACKLLATTCCVCSRPLVDALSVEMGIGPDCRKKYMGKLEGPAREEANKIVHQLALVVSGYKPEHIEGLDQDAVQAAYAIGGTKAVGAMLAATHAVGTSLLDRLRQLGFDKLADKFEAAWLPVRITEENGVLAVQAPYDQDAVDAQRVIPGRRWDKEKKLNTFPLSQKAAVWKMLNRFYAGVAGIGPKGAFVIGRAAVAPQPSGWLQNAVAITASHEEAEMMRMEAEADRAGTLRDEMNKAYARGML